MSSGFLPHRLEIDVLQVSDIEESAQLSFKYGLSAMVVHGSLIQEAMLARAKVKGKYKLIAPIDWPKGEKEGALKFRDTNIDIFEADGFEIVLSDKPAKMVNTEVKSIIDFVRGRLDEQMEVRFVLNVYSRPNYLEICKGLVGCRNPDQLRLDINTRGQVTKCNYELHNKFIADIGTVISLPIKASGNINNSKIARACNAEKFAVSLIQAKTIIKEQ